MVCCTTRSLIPRRASHLRVKLHCVHHTMESDAHREDRSAECIILRSQAHSRVKNVEFVIEYLDKIEAEFENTLACFHLSGAQISSNHEKKEVKNLVTHSLYHTFCVSTLGIRPFSPCRKKCYKSFLFCTKKMSIVTFCTTIKHFSFFGTKKL